MPSVERVVDAARRVLAADRVALHEIPLERRTLHGHFSRDLEPILTVESGDSIAFACLNAGWRDAAGARVEYRAEGDELDAGHALVGPVEVEGARAGQTLVVEIDEIRIGTWGYTDAGGWYTPLNERLGVARGRERRARAGGSTRTEAVGRDQAGSRGRPCAPSSASSGCRPTSRGSTRPRRRGGAAGTSTARSSSPGRRSSSRSPSTVRCSPPATAMPLRATARCRSSRSRRRSSARVLTLSVRDDLPLGLADRVDAGGVADVRLRRGPRRGGGDRDRRDARPDGARARARRARGACSRERRRRSSRDAARQRSARNSRATRARRAPLDDNSTRCRRGSSSS